MIPTTTILTGLLAISLAAYSICTMSRHSIWPTITLGLLGLGLIFMGATIGVATWN